MPICVAIATATRQQKKTFRLYAPICMNRLAFLAVSHAVITLCVVGVPFIERPKKQVRFGSIPKSALLKSRRPYWGSKKLFYSGEPATDPRPASALGPGNHFRWSRIIPARVPWSHPSGIADRHWRGDGGGARGVVFFFCASGHRGRHGTGHGRRAITCCSRRP